MVLNKSIYKSGRPENLELKLWNEWAKDLNMKLSKKVQP